MPRQQAGARGVPHAGPWGRGASLCRLGSSSAALGDALGKPQREMRGWGEGLLASLAAGVWIAVPGTEPDTEDARPVTQPRGDGAEAEEGRLCARPGPAGARRARGRSRGSALRAGARRGLGPGCEPSARRRAPVLPRRLPGCEPRVAQVVAGR